MIANWSLLTEKGYNPNPPELAIEIISDSSNAEEHRQLRLKLTNYLAAGVTVWIVDAATRRVEVHHSAGGTQEFDETGILSAESILPGFRLPVKDIFPKKKDCLSFF